MDAQAVVSLADGLRTYSYMNVLASALLFYDYLLTFRREMVCIWRGRLTLITVLFFITRYLPFVENIVTLVYISAHEPSNHACYVLWVFLGYVYTFGLFAADALLVARTYALWTHDKRVLAGLLFQYFGSLGAGIYIAAKLFSTVAFSPNPFDVDVVPGCFLSQGNNILYIPYAILLGLETVIFILTGIRAYSTYQRELAIGQGSSSLYHTIYRDGLLFYFFILVTSIANIAIITGTSGETSYSLTGIHRVLHAILAERLVLNIREAVDKGGVGGSGAPSGEWLAETAIELNVRSSNSRGTDEVVDIRPRLF